MKTAFGIVVTISITFNLFAVVLSAGPTDDTSVVVSTQVANKDSSSSADDALKQKKIKDEATNARFAMEGFALGFLMLHLGTGHYLPIDTRTEVVLICGAGHGNTVTGILGFIVLQQRLIDMKKAGKVVEPYTKVIVTIHRKKRTGDKFEGPESKGDVYENLLTLLSKLRKVMTDEGLGYEEFTEEEPIPNSVSAEEVEPVIENNGKGKGKSAEEAAEDKASGVGLEPLIKNNTGEIEKSAQPVPETEVTAEQVEEALKPALDRFWASFDTKKIRIVMDIMMGSGGKGNKIADKSFFNLMLTKKLHQQNVPVFLHDGKSCGASTDHTRLGFDLGTYLVYGVDTTTFKGGQGLIITPTKLKEALSHLTAAAEITDATVADYDGQTLPVFANENLDTASELELGEYFYTNAIFKEGVNIQTAFEHITFVSLGKYCHKRPAAIPSAAQPLVGQSTVGQSTAGQSTEGSSTAGPSTTGPSTAGQSTEGSSTAGPSTAGPSTAGQLLAARHPETEPSRGCFPSIPFKNFIKRKSSIPK